MREFSLETTFTVVKVEHTLTSGLAVGEGFWRLVTDFGKASGGCDSGSCCVDAVELNQKEHFFKRRRDLWGQKSLIQEHLRRGVYLFWSGCSCLFAHPVPSLGTIITLGSFPLFSDFKLGRWAGGGMRRAVTTLPRLCKPCRGTTGWQTTGGHSNRGCEVKNIQQGWTIWRNQGWRSK